jgi:phosphoglycerate kinase
LNVPIEDGVVTNRFRLEKIVPTIEFLRARGARVVLLGHIGRDPHESLEPVFAALTNLVPLSWCPATIGDRAVRAIAALEDGDVLMLENVRQHAGEEANDPAFARGLAALGDCYVNDAFADSHRAHASVVGVPQHLPSAFGPAFRAEYEALLGARTPTHPALFMLGGAKIETKLPLVTAFLEVYDSVFLGGALAHDVWRAKGYELGMSLVGDMDLAGSPLLSASNVMLPIDVTVTDGSYVRVTTPDAVHATEKIVDMGPETVAMLAPHVRSARTILWNGPFGNYEDGFATATERIAELVAASSSHSIVGGGDTIASIESLALKDQFGFLSTAGGAMLTFLETGTLPGITAITAQ